MIPKEINARKFANVDRAVVDPRLTDFDYRLLGLMVKLARGGVVHELQKDLAQAHGKGATVRAVQRSRDRLVWFGYLVPIRKSTYSVLGRATLQSPLEDDPTVAFDETATEQGDPTVRKGGPTVQKGDPPFVHSTPSPLVSLSDDGDTEPGAPRQRADALGAPSEADESKGLSDGQAAAALPEPTDAPGPLSDPSNTFGARLRQRVSAKDFASCFAEVHLVSLKDGLAVLSTSRPYIAQKLRGWFRPDLELVAGARIEIVVREAEPSPESRQ
ncbi:hypothetical protein BjapCC829_10795 [Bradyrhizobium barranii]|uniref:DnaA N-terminal domain-containing protein n=1 Tax=Bradyrhizobium barranii TaxID=2992140 RepID=A0ABY3QSM8_9BRAD|nr:hypothetical protein [Bradyrhizobium japonicum]UFW88950.1 hypothetical protein BjapCC829_10795 [Bradyrhizobium japonicum]